MTTSIKVTTDNKGVSVSTRTYSANAEAINALLTDRLCSDVRLNGAVRDATIEDLESAAILFTTTCHMSGQLEKAQRGGGFVFNRKTDAGKAMHAFGERCAQHHDVRIVCRMSDDGETVTSQVKPVRQSNTAEPTPEAIAMRHLKALLECLPELDSEKAGNVAEQLRTLADSLDRQS